MTCYPQNSRNLNVAREPVLVTPGSAALSPLCMCVRRGFAQNQSILLIYASLQRRVCVCVCRFAVFFHQNGARGYAACLLQPRQD